MSSCASAAASVSEKLSSRLRQVEIEFARCTGCKRTTKLSRPAFQHAAKRMSPQAAARRSSRLSLTARMNAHAYNFQAGDEWSDRSSSPRLGMPAKPLARAQGSPQPLSFLAIVNLYSLRHHLRHSSFHIPAHLLARCSTLSRAITTILRVHCCRYPTILGWRSLAGPRPRRKC